MRSKIWLVLLVLLLGFAVWVVFGSRSSLKSAPVPVEAGRSSEAPNARITIETPDGSVAEFIHVLEGGRAPLDAGAEVGEQSRLVGTVVAAESEETHGQPIAGVEVVAYGPPQEKTFARTETDASGHFDLSIGIARKYEVLFRHPEWSLFCVEDLRLRQDLPTRLDVALHAASELRVIVEGSSTGSLASPVRDAVVVLLAGSFDKAVYFDEVQRDIRGTRATTNGDGVASMSGADAGPHYLIVQAKGFATWMKEVDLARGSNERRVQLSTAGAIDGVLWESSGRPASRAWVFIAPEEFPVDRIREVMYAQEVERTDEKGVFHFDGVPSGRHGLAAVCSNGETAALAGVVEITDSGEVQHVELRAIASASIDGRVLDEEGRPILGAEVYVSSTSSLHHEIQVHASRSTEAAQLLRRSAKSDTEGRFSLERVPTYGGKGELNAGLEGYLDAEAELDLVPGGRVSQELVLVRLDSHVSGRIRMDDGRPFPGAMVGFKVTSGPAKGSSSMGETTSDGRFLIPVPSKGAEATVRPLLGGRSARAYEIQPVEYTDVRPGQDDLDFELSLRQRLKGRVVDSDGRPVNRFELHLYSDVARDYADPVSVENDQGAFDIPWNPEGDLYLKITGQGFQPFEVWDLDRNARRELLVRLQPLAAVLRGQLLDADGGPCGGARIIRASSDEGASFPRRSRFVPVSTTAADGTFELPGVEFEGTIHLLVAPGMAGAPPLVPFRLDTGAPRHDLVLKLPRTEPVTIQLVSRSRDPFDGTFLIVDEKGFPLDPRIEPVLAAGANPKDAKSRGGDRSEINMHLAAGRYRAYCHSGPGFVKGSLDSYQFEVQERQRNAFTFEVD